MIPVILTTLRRIRKAQRPPKSKRVDVTRAEFDRVIDLLNQRGLILNDLHHNLEIQFKRISDMQADIDRLKGLLDRKPLRGTRDS
jgi:hypothetical protein